MNWNAFRFMVLLTIPTVDAVAIGIDTIKPFAQPEPTTISEKAAVKFKPQLRISDGCHSYAAVNAAGDTSAGLLLGSSAGCDGSDLGSQVYGRSAWYSDMWGIMYAWYFPKDDADDSRPYRQHSWENIVVWIDNPAVEIPTVLGVSASQGSGYARYAPPYKRNMDGNSPKIKYFHDDEARDYHWLDVAVFHGDFQDLIMWSQLTDEARTALQGKNFGGVGVPFSDANFTANLAMAWPAIPGRKGAK